MKKKIFINVKLDQNVLGYLEVISLFFSSRADIFVAGIKSIRGASIDDINNLYIESCISENKGIARKIVTNFQGKIPEDIYEEYKDILAKGITAKKLLAVMIYKLYKDVSEKRPDDSFNTNFIAMITKLGIIYTKASNGDESAIETIREIERITFRL